MPTVAELERLDALVSRLTPLTEVQRGELIRAQDWNTVVGALIEVLRAVLAGEQDGIVETHEHPDQVSAGWLDPKLRALIERGPLTDPAAAAKLAELDRRVQRQTERSETVIGEQNAARERMAEITTNDLARQSALTQLTRTVEGMVDAREEVMALRSTLGQLETDVKLAVEAAERFTVDGAPVDMQAFNERLRQIEILRERLTSPDGSLFDAGALEIRLTELTNTLVTEEELDAALQTVRGDLSEAERQALIDAIRPLLSADIEAGSAVLRGEIEAQAVALRSEDAAGLETLRGEIAQAGQALRDMILGDLNSRMAELADTLRAEGKQSDDALRGEITQAVQTLRDSLMSDLDQRIAEQLDALRSEMKENDEALRSEITEMVQGLRDSLAGEIDQRMAEAVEKLRAEIQEALEQLRGSMQSIAEAVTKEMLADELGPIRERISELLQRVERLEQRNQETDRLIAILLQRIGSVSPVGSSEPSAVIDEAQTQLEAAIEKAVKAEINKLNRRLPGLIKKQIDAQAGPG